MTEPPPKSTSPPDLGEQRGAHLKRLDAAETTHGVQTSAFQDQKPKSAAKLDDLRDYIISDWYDPAVAELAIGALSAGGTAQTLLVSIDQAKRAMGKGQKYGRRNKLLKAIALKFEQKKPDYLGNRIDAIRDLIIEALKCRVDRLEMGCTLDEWFDDEDDLYCDEVLARFRKGSGEVIAATTIANILSLQN